MVLSYRLPLLQIIHLCPDYYRHTSDSLRLIDIHGIKILDAELSRELITQPALDRLPNLLKLRVPAVSHRSSRYQYNSTHVHLVCKAQMSHRAAT